MKRPARLLAIAALSAAVTLPLAALAPTATGQDREPAGRDEANLVEVEDTGEDLDQDVDADVRTEGGEKVKVFRFSGLDLAGRLKSPQLLYFLNRMRAEFDRPRLPHRSFIPELQRSAQGKAFR